MAEIANILLFCIPSIALIWYLILKTKKTDIWAIKTGKKDIVCALVTLPFLLLTGIIITVISAYAGGTSIKINSPSTAIEWLIVCISCICFAYLEESYFRYYLLTKRKELNLNAPSALVLSAAMFSVCHIYAGPWSFLNAAISGTFLGFIFLRYNSFHGIAIAHGLYNIIAYAAAR
jgi:hypothetical protein